MNMFQDTDSLEFSSYLKILKKAPHINNFESCSIDELCSFNSYFCRQISMSTYFFRTFQKFQVPPKWAWSINKKQFLFLFCPNNDWTSKKMKMLTNRKLSTIIKWKA